MISRPTTVKPSIEDFELPQFTSTSIEFVWVTLVENKVYDVVLVTKINMQDKIIIKFTKVFNSLIQGSFFSFIVVNV